MDLERILTDEMRLTAIEVLVSKIYAAQLFQLGVTVDTALPMFEAARQDAASQILPGLNPVQSDLAAQEFSDAIARLLDMSQGALEELEEIARARAQSKENL